MIYCRTQVLSERNDINTGRAQVVERLHDLLVRLTEPEHQTALRQNLRVVTLGVLEHAHRLLVSRARIAHWVRQAPDRLDVLRKHFQSGINNRLDVRQDAFKIGSQRLDSRRRTALLDRAYARRVVSSSP